MKFDCGETYAERLERLSNWHRVFAWFPVRVGPHDCRWLETVERKEIGGSLSDEWKWEYRCIKEN